MRVRDTLPLILRDDPFNNFMQLSDSLFDEVGCTSNISLRRLFALVHSCLVVINDIHEKDLMEKMKMDYQRTGEKTSFEFLLNKRVKAPRVGVANKRQKKMLKA